MNHELENFILLLSLKNIDIEIDDINCDEVWLDLWKEDSQDCFAFVRYNSSEGFRFIRNHSDSDTEFLTVYKEADQVFQEICNLGIFK